MRSILLRVFPSLLFLCICLGAHASNDALSIDSLKTVLAHTKNKKARLETMVLIMQQAYRSNPDDAAGIDKQILTEAHALNDIGLLACAYLCTGKHFILKDNFEEAAKQINTWAFYRRARKITKKH
jgi:hypothetical protein